MGWFRKTERVEVLPEEVKQDLAQLTNKVRFYEERAGQMLAWMEGHEIVVSRRFLDQIGLTLPGINGMVLSYDPAQHVYRYIPAHLDRQRAIKIAAEELAQATKDAEAY